MSAQELMANNQQLRDTHMLLLEITTALNKMETGDAGVISPSSLIPSIKTLVDVVHGLAEDLQKLKHVEISGRMAKGGFDNGNA